MRQVGVLARLLTELLSGLAALGLTMVGGIGIAQKLLGGALQDLSWGLLVSLLVIGAALLGLIFLSRRSFPLSRDSKAKEDILDRQRQALGDHQTPVDVPVLAVRVSGDKAGGWLEVWSMITGLPYVLRNRIVLLGGVTVLAGVAFYLLGLPYVTREPEERAIRLMLALGFSTGLACVL